MNVTRREVITSGSRLVSALTNGIRPNARTKICMSCTDSINIAEFGAIPGDDATEAFQKAIDHSVATGEEIFVPQGVYYVSRTLSFLPNDAALGPRIRGLGRGRSIVVFDITDGSPLFRFQNQTRAKFIRGGYVKDLEIRSRKGLPHDCQGPAFMISGWWHFDLHSLLFLGLRGHAINFPDRSDLFSNSDFYQILGASISRCEALALDGSFVLGQCGLGATRAYITDNYIRECRGGAIRIGGHFTKISNNSFAFNGRKGFANYPTITIERQLRSTGMGLSISNNELHGSAGPLIKLNGVLNAAIFDNRIVTDEQPTWENGQTFPHTAIAIDGADASNQHIHFYRNYFRHRNNHPFTGFDFGDSSNNTLISVRDTRWDGLTSPRFTGVSNGQRVEIVDDDYFYRPNPKIPQFLAEIQRKQTLTASLSKVVFDLGAEDLDCFFSTLNGEFTPPYSGLYHVIVQLTLIGIPPGTEVVIEIRSASTTYVRNVQYAKGNGGSESFHLYGVTPLSRGLPIWVRGSQSSGDDKKIVGDVESSYFSVVAVG